MVSRQLRLCGEEHFPFLHGFSCTLGRMGVAAICAGRMPTVVAVGGLRFRNCSERVLWAWFLNLRGAVDDRANNRNVNDPRAPIGDPRPKTYLRTFRCGFPVHHASIRRSGTSPLMVRFVSREVCSSELGIRPR